MITRLFSTLIYLIALLVVYPSTTFAAPSIQVLDLPGNTVTKIELPAGALSMPMTVKLSEDPKRSLVVQVKVTGEIPLTISPAELRFNQTNWSKEQRVVLEYAGANEGSGSLGFAGLGLNAVNIPVTVVIDGQKPAEAANFNIKELNNIAGFSSLSVDDVVTKGIAAFLTLITLAAFISLLYSGFLYITAGGNADQATKARRNIVWALTSLIIALLAYVVLRLIVGALQ